MEPAKKMHFDVVSASEKRLRNAFVALVVVIHCLMVLLPSVNQEFVFADGAQFFTTHDQGLLDRYFSYQANTLGLPWLAHIVAYVLPFRKLAVIRLLSVAGIVLLTAGFIRISRYQGRPVGINMLALLLLNPLIWTYSARATADFLPAALAIFAISLAIEAGRNVFLLLLSGALLGFASILKPHVFCVFLVLFGLLWTGRKRVSPWSPAAIVFLASMGMLAAYLAKVHEAFGFWIAPPRFQHIHALSTTNIGGNFVAYVGFLVMLTAPLSLIIPGIGKFLQRHWKLLLPLAIGLVLVFAVGIHGEGEMNLGPLDRFVPKSVQSGIFILLSMFFLAPVLVSQGVDDSNAHMRKAVGLAVLAALLVFSLSRPAQRYLLPLLPLFLLILPREALRKKTLIMVTLLIFASINVFIGYSQWCTGTAAIKMVQALQSAGLLDETDPGAIAGDVGNYFRAEHLGNARYVVVPGVVNNSRLTVRSGGPLGKAYSLVAVANGEHR
ncbi:hypothetical protein AWB81_04677 [Caballeronia arationis]|uniref:hypothetical protein n=1 Tax=Caballeronia arationis TaxID=1777142 RepID=UPI00074B8B4E|nr:hypothetical protein [Caballeronia arationis]SAK88681.1 hypothetical protein AWB81_04677 [Caballeronia arationis]